MSEKATYTAGAARPLSEDTMRRAAFLAADSLLRAYPRSVAEEPVFSPEFQAAMAPLLRRAGRRQHLEQVRRWVAGILLALAVLGGLLLAVHPEARAGVIRWIREAWQGVVSYRFQGEPSSDSLPDYRPVWLPEGLSETEIEEYAPDGAVILRTITYLFDEDESRGVMFVYGWIQEGSGVSFIGDTPEARRREVLINGLPGELIEPEDSQDMTNLIWFDEKRNIELVLSGTVDGDTLLRMAESVAPVKQAISK